MKQIRTIIGKSFAETRKAYIDGWKSHPTLHATVISLETAIILNVLIMDASRLSLRVFLPVIIRLVGLVTLFSTALFRNLRKTGN